MGEKIYKKYATFTKPLHSVKTDLKIKRYCSTRRTKQRIFLGGITNEKLQASHIYDDAIVSSNHRCSLWE
jgi:hypothetical protein